jgi:L-cysteine desulfidase
MEKKSPEYRKYTSILEEELIPAMGCTEPIAVAYCAAVARETLGMAPDRVEIFASGNIIKNVKSVVVPNTNGMRGIAAAAAAGIVAGDAAKELQVIASVTDEEKETLRAFLEQVPIKIEIASSGLVFDLTVLLHAGEHWSKVRIANFHTNIVYVERDGKVLRETEIQANTETELTDRTFMTAESILDYADSVILDDVRPLLRRQIECNMAIAEEGIRGDYGANIGSVLLKSYQDLSDLHSENSILLKCRAYAAAGSDARMNGCEMPVIINSGSGNQGITASVPVIVFARESDIDEERLYRALVLSNLLAIYQKTPIGRLSAYCGVINAGTAAVCGIAYLKGESFKMIAHTLVNSLAVSSGVICDGAKASCAGKIALALDIAILGYRMYQNGQQFYGGDGIVKKGVDRMVSGVGRLGREGMRGTDEEILRIMLEP